MLRRVSVFSTRFGYALNVDDTPPWAAAVPWAYEKVMALLGHPCCGQGIWGRLPEPLAERVWDVAYAGLNAASRVAWNRERRVLQVPLTAEQAEALLPPEADDDDDEEDGILLDACCPWCSADFADGTPDAWAINLLRLHMVRGECRN